MCTDKISDLLGKFRQNVDFRLVILVIEDALLSK